MTIAVVSQACHRSTNPKDLTNPNPNPTDPTNPNQPTTNPSLPQQ